MHKMRILGIGDGGVATGFARVMESILGNLPEEEYEVHQLAVNYLGDPYERVDYKLYPARLGGDMLGVGRLDDLIESIKPDLIFILNDSWVLAKHYLTRLEKYEDIPVVVYFPVDAHPLKPRWCEKIIESTDRAVAYTEFGKQAITQHFPEAEIDIIPHGVDTDTFYPVDQVTAREALQGINTDDFIILNLNRNQPRKRIDLTIKGFAKFAENKPKSVKLYLHMGLEDMGWSIIDLCGRYGIDDRLLITSTKLSPSSYVSDRRLNWIYNACDIGLNTSQGEGWGLSHVEHGACGKAQITPYSSAAKSIYTEDMVRFIPIDHYDTYPKTMTEGAVVAPDAVAEALEFYYQNADVRQQHAKNLYNFVTKEKFEWANIAKQWDSLFKETV